MCLPERLVAEVERGVDDVLAITTHNHKTSVGVVLERLWVDLTASHVLRGQNNELSVLGQLCHLHARVHSVSKTGSQWEIADERTRIFDCGQSD